MFIPLVPALVLDLVSFFCAAFTVFRIIVPILPPNPLSRRVPPSEFGLPDYGRLSTADKAHIWLSVLDILSVAVLMWQVIGDSLSGQVDSLDPASSARFWFALTARQICLLLVAANTLLHIRLGQSVSFGAKHWIIAMPILVIVCISTSVAVVLSGAYVPSLFIGLVAFSSITAFLTTITLIFIQWTVVKIKRNLAALDSQNELWPQMEEKPRPSFATEDVDVLRDGASWITSDAGSRRNSISAWSFSTYHTAVHNGSVRNHGSSTAHASVPPRSSFWFKALSSASHEPEVPPVPPLPSPYRGQSVPVLNGDPDPFRRDVPPYSREHGRHASQSSWLTSPSVSQATLSAWSYPASQSDHGEHNVDAPRPSSRPAMSSAQVLGGYGYANGDLAAERGLRTSSVDTRKIEVSLCHTLAWLVYIWLPLGLSLPYLISSFHKSSAAPSHVSPILLVLSVTVSAPLLALNVIFRAPLPIPSGLFESQLPEDLLRPTSPTATLPGLPSRKISHGYKRSGSVTVVEGRRSGDVWLDNGDAVEGKGKVGRMLGMMMPKPRLVVLAPKEDCREGELTPPLPIQTGDSPLPQSPSAELVLHVSEEDDQSIEVGRSRKNSKASSHLSGGDDSMAYASRIMIAQRHYSAMAQTVVVPASPDGRTSIGAGQTFDLAKTSGVAKPSRPTSHLRTRSISSVSGPVTPSSGSIGISPPPSFPLPPTPPNVRAARLAQLGHKKSFSSGFSFGPVEDMNEIDAMTAGVLPLLVPGLKVGPNMRIKPEAIPVTYSRSNKRSPETLKAIDDGFGGQEGGEFPSPEVHSTPAKVTEQATRVRKVSGHKKNHFSLPSLSLGKDGIHSIASWKAEICRALENQLGKYTSASSNAVVADSPPASGAMLEAVQEEREDPVPNKETQLTRAMSTRSLGLKADVPDNVGTARSSLISLNAPLSAASTVTLFELDTELESGPQAESTPPNTLARPQTNQRLHAQQNPTNKRRSSIIYIRSDNYEPAATTDPNSPAPDTHPTNSTRLSQWSSRAMRPLTSKSSKLMPKNSKLNLLSSTAKPDSPGRGLRQLSLLKDRDVNTLPTVSDAGAYGTTPPLFLRKKQKSRLATVNDENAEVSSSPKRKNLKPLQLVRSETAKMRGILRRDEVLPHVIVRPPSEAEADDTSPTYTFAI